MFEPRDEKFHTPKPAATTADATAAAGLARGEATREELTMRPKRCPPLVAAASRAADGGEGDATEAPASVQLAGSSPAVQWPPTPVQHPQSKVDASSRIAAFDAASLAKAEAFVQRSKHKECRRRSGDSNYSRHAHLLEEMEAKLDAALILDSRPPESIPGSDAEQIVDKVYVCKLLEKTASEAHDAAKKAEPELTKMVQEQAKK
jgi:hypothetical protein